MQSKKLIKFWKKSPPGKQGGKEEQSWLKIMAENTRGGPQKASYRRGLLLRRSRKKLERGTPGRQKTRQGK